MRMFVFGTLQDPDLLAAVIGRPTDEIARVPAYLPGKRAVRVENETYPTLIDDEQGTVHGQILGPMEGADVDRILFFEAEEYDFSPTMVEAPDGPSQVHIFAPAERTIATGEDWSLDAWQHADKDEAVAVAHAFMGLYGICSAEEADEQWREVKEATLARLRRTVLA